MRTICIQVQKISDTGLDVELVLQELRVNGIEPEIKNGNDDGEYTNLIIEDVKIDGLWPTIHPRLMKLPGFEQNTITTCTGKFGWDDYLLLNHFDSTVVLDEFKRN